MGASHVTRSTFADCCLAGRIDFWQPLPGLGRGWGRYAGMPLGAMSHLFRSWMSTNRLSLECSDFRKMNMCLCAVCSAGAGPLAARKPGPRDPTAYRSQYRRSGYPVLGQGVALPPLHCVWQGQRERERESESERERFDMRCVRQGQARPAAGMAPPWREAGPPNHLDDKVDSDQ